jgi:hypothetical protein
MRPTDVQQVEAHRSRSGDLSTGVDDAFAAFNLNAKKSSPEDTVPSRPDSRSISGDKSKPSSSLSRGTESSGTQKGVPERGSFRPVLTNDKIKISGSGDRVNGQSARPLGTGSKSGDRREDWTNHRSGVPQRSEERGHTYYQSYSGKPQYPTESSVPRQNPSAQADYSSFRAGGAFASPVRPQHGTLKVDPSSRFARPQVPVQRPPSNSWMTDQVITHQATQRLNGKPPVNIIPYGLGAGSSNSGQQADDGEDFSNALNGIKHDPADTIRVSADQAEADMRELLSGAIGDGEDNQAEEGSNLVDGFADGMSLMPHQVRGVAWLGQRETGLKRGGILADVSLRDRLNNENTA